MDLEKQFTEKFIEKDIAPLAQDYDFRRGKVINVQRIAADLIDGLKPVQRRAIYIMFLKDGGRTFRKLATISGEVFGRAHPHCLHGDTKFVLIDYNNHLLYTKSIKELYELSSHDHSNLKWDSISANINKDNTTSNVYYDKPTPCNISNVRITKYVNEYYEIYLANGAVIKCTDDHQHLICDANSWGEKIIVNWVAAKDIKVGDHFLITADNRAIGINHLNAFIAVTKVNIVHSDEPIPMYDFTSSNCENAAIYLDTDDDSFVWWSYTHNSPVAIEDAIVNMEQPWHNSIPLIDGEGNFGSIAGNPAGASRYIKARLSEYAIACFFEDWKDSVVDMQLAYDEETKIPEYLPAKYPNVLLNGCLGIGFGVSCNMFPTNFREVVEATIRLMQDPKANVVIIPDSPTGASIVQTDFAKICNKGVGTYSQRCTYEIDNDKNMITITSIPDQVTVNSIRERIADIKVQGGLPELLNMDDLTRSTVELQLTIREDVNPYKFIRKLIKEVAGLERAYPVTITITNDYNSVDYSVKGLLLDWIKWRREQKRVSISNKRTTLVADQRANDVKLFIMDPKNLDDTVKIFRTSRNRAEIEQRLIERYHNTEIRMDSLQARTLSSMRMVDLTIESYEACVKRKAELEEELKKVEEILDTENGIDKVIIAELKDGIKRFGSPRKSNVVPAQISVSNEVEGSCILQLSSEGMILRKPCTNAEEDPIPNDCNGFAIYVNNDESFIIIDENGYHSFIRVNELPVDSEVPLNRFMKKSLSGKIVAMLPVDMDSNRCCTLISKKGIVKRIRIADIGPSKKPCITMDPDDHLVRGIVLPENSHKEILVYTEEGYGQRLLSSSIKITSPMAKGGSGFKLTNNDVICGSFVIDPIDSQYLLYTTLKGKMRLNRLEFLPVRNTKHDLMVNLIQLNDRDKLVSVQGCNKLDKATAYFVDGTSETIEINKLEESTMSSKPKKILNKDMSTSQSNVVKIKIV